MRILCSQSVIIHATEKRRSDVARGWESLPYIYDFSQSISFIFKIMSEVLLPRHTMPGRDSSMWLTSLPITHHSEQLYIGSTCFLQSNLRKTFSDSSDSGSLWCLLEFSRPTTADGQGGEPRVQHTKGKIIA